MLRPSFWPSGIRLAGWCLLAVVNLLIYSICIQVLRDGFKFGHPNVLIAMESLVSFLLTIPFATPLPHSLGRRRIIALALANFGSRVLLVSALFFSTDSTVSLTQYAAVFILAYFEFIQSPQPVVLGSIVLIVAGSILLSIHSIYYDFWAALANLCLFFAIVSNSLHLFQIGTIYKLKPLTIIHEMTKYQMCGYTTVAVLSDSYSDVSVREYDFTLPFVLLLLFVLVVFLFMCFCDLFILLETSPVTFEVILIERMNVARLIRFAAVVVSGGNVGMVPLRTGLGIAVSIVGLGIYLFLKAREENRIGYLPLALQVPAL
jgi:hypothetical protein